MEYFYFEAYSYNQDLFLAKCVGDKVLILKQAYHKIDEQKMQLEIWVQSTMVEKKKYFREGYDL